MPRNKQVQQLEAELRTKRALVLRGEQKVGKSRLLDILCTHCSDKKQLYLRYCLSRDETPINAFHRFYERLMGAEVETEITMVAECFEQLEEQQILLILENVDVLQPDQWSRASATTNIWQQLLERIRDKGQRSSVIIEAAFSSAFKRHPEEPCCSEEDWPEWTLYGFTSAEGTLFLANQGMTGYAADVRESISQHVYGNPALLRWIATHPESWTQFTGQVEEQRQFAHALFEYMTRNTHTASRLQARLSDDARQILLALILTRLPLQDAFLDVLLTIRPYDISYLLREGLLVYYGDDECYIPGEVRYYVLAQSTPKDYRAVHCLLYHCYTRLLQQSSNQRQRRRYIQERQYHANSYRQHE